MGNRNEGLRAASLHSSPLQDGSKHGGPTALYSTCVLEVGMVLLLPHFSASPWDFPGGAALWIKLPVLQNKVQNEAKAGGVCHSSLCTDERGMGRLEISVSV